MATIQYTLIARAADGLHLCAEEMNEGGVVVAKEVRDKAASLASSMRDQPDDARLIVDAGDHKHYFSCLRMRGVAFIVAVGRGYPRDAAYTYTETISHDFFEFLAGQGSDGAADRGGEEDGAAAGEGGAGVRFRKHHTSSRGAGPPSLPLEAITAAYACMAFDRVIARHRRALADPASKGAAARVHAHLGDIHSYMSENIDALLARGEGMGELRDKSNLLAERAKQLQRGAKRLHDWRTLQMYMIPVAAAILIFIGLFLRFYVFA
jgi:hypothetical protein